MLGARSPPADAKRSSPAVKCLPSAHSIAHRISGSLSISSKACLISWKNMGAIALSFLGLSSTTSATWSFLSSRITVYSELIFVVPVGGMWQYFCGSNVMMIPVFCVVRPIVGLWGWFEYLCPEGVVAR